MHIDWWTLGLQTVNVLVLVWILGRFLFRPVAAMIETRRVEAARLLDDARAAREAAEAERQKAQAETANLVRTRGEAMKQAAADAETEKQGLLAAAHAEADRLKVAAAADIARERQDLAAGAADHAGRLALDIAAKLLSRLPDDARVAGFIDGLAQGLSDLPKPVRASLGADGSPIRLIAARILTAAEAQACRERLSQALGRPVEIAPMVDPGLVAGLEIDMPHAAVRNSFRADLDRIATALQQDGRQAP